MRKINRDLHPHPHFSTLAEDVCPHAAPPPLHLRQGRLRPAN